MRIERTSETQFVVRSGDQALELNHEQYEDLYYAVPLDPTTLYILLNETLLETREERETLQSIVDREGGFQESMSTLSELIQSLDPEQVWEQGEEQIVRVSPETVNGSDGSASSSRSVGTDEVNDGDRSSGEAESAGAKEEGEEVEILQKYDGRDSLQMEVEEETVVFSYQDTAIRVPPSRIEELYDDLPQHTPELFKKFMTVVFQSAKSQKAFRRLLDQAGGITNSLNIILDQLKKNRESFFQT